MTAAGPGHQIPIVGCEDGTIVGPDRETAVLALSAGAAAGGHFAAMTGAHQIRLDIPTDFGEFPAGIGAVEKPHPRPPEQKTTTV